MSIKKIEKNGCNLHLIKNKNFKTVFIKLFFWNEIKEDEITIRNLMFNNLLFSSKKYNSSRKLSMKKADLYGLEIIQSTVRRSSYIFNEISVSVIADKYAEKGLVKEAFSFIFDILKNPNIENDKFNEENFKLTKKIMNDEIKRELENPNNFAIRKYKELLGKEKIYKYSLNGTLDNLNKITSSSLYNYYKKFFKNNNIDIVIAGNIDFNELEEVFMKECTFKGNNKYLDNIYLTYEKKETLDIIKTLYNQSKLIMGASTKDLTVFEKKYTSVIYNIIFGNSPKSKLFQNVREKKSFAYSINSSFNRLDGLFIIYSGISRKNYEETKKEVLKQMKEMEIGSFTEEDIESAKTFIKIIIEEADDYLGSIIDRYFSNLYFDSDSKTKQIKAIESIKKEDIINLAKKLKIDTTLLIEEQI